MTIDKTIDPPLTIAPGTAQRDEMSADLEPREPQASANAGEWPVCEILGVNEQRVVGKLVRFSSADRLIEVQLTGIRRHVSLRFDQFRMLTWAEWVRSPDMRLGQQSPSTVRVEWKSGDSLELEALRMQEAEAGFFLTLPVAVSVPGSESVRRAFLPRANFAQVVSGPPATPVTPATAVTAAKALPPVAARTPQAVELSLTPVEAPTITPPATPPATEPPAAENELQSMMSVEVTTPDQLLVQLEKQSRMPIVRIGEALSSLGMITDEQLRAGLERQQLDRSVPLGETLVQMGIVTSADLQTALARKMGYPMVNLQRFPASPEALRKLGYPAAHRLQAIPLMLHEGRLIVAMDDPVNRHKAVDEMEFIAQMKVTPVLGQARDLGGAMHRAYEKIGGTADMRGAALADPSRPLDFDLTGTSELLQNLEKEDQAAFTDEAPIEQSDNSLVRLINRMILEAHREGASDIHIESYPGREKIRIRFRRDGRLSTYMELPPNYRNAIIARIKIMCDLDISEKRKPQDGKISFAKFSPQHPIELRVATIPTNNGLEDVVMRILASAKPMALEQLGLSAHNLSSLSWAVKRPYGMVLCVGPTGSGKTTTLHSALMHINTPERKIWTAEDPIEITQTGLRQVQVNPRIEWTFAKALRAFVRADPDVIMVGEIRDEETAKTAIEASLTGHLVLSTLHTNSAPETVTRLLDMGMDPFNFADSLLAILAQRLVRRLCSQCTTSRPASEEEIGELLADYLHAFGTQESPPDAKTVKSEWLANHGKEGRLQSYKAVGCKHCGNTGFRGRVGLHELMLVSRTLRRQIQEGARAEELQATALTEGMRTLRQDGIAKVLSGLTTIDEVRATSNV